MWDEQQMAMTRSTEDPSRISIRGVELGADALSDARRVSGLSGDTLIHGTNVRGGYIPS